MRSIYAAILLLIAAFACAVAAPAQLPTSTYLAGGSYSPGAKPAFAGTALYAHKLTDATAAFTVVDFLPASIKPFTVTTSIGAGIAQRVTTIAKVPIYIPTDAGISFNGGNVDWAWSTGIGAPYQVKPNWYLMPTLRVRKSVDGYTPIFGVLFGWGRTQ